MAYEKISFDALITDLIGFMDHESMNELEFNQLALKIFSFQFEHNRPFRKFCQGRGKTPRLVKTWRDIPAVPINAFKDLTLSCIDPENCVRTFTTSGTTRAEIKGKHHHPTLAVYDTSMVKNFNRNFMREDLSLKMGILFPNELLMPNSSLAHYLALALEHFGAPGSAYFVNEKGLQVETLCNWIENAQNSIEPISLLGASYSFVHLMDELNSKGLTYRLPLGSRILDTGGYKGQSREIPMDVFYDRLSFTFGIERSQCINMYGMTELSTQFYDYGNLVVPSIKRGPHWIRSRLVDPMTTKEVPFGQRGILAHTDLANFNSVVTILTEDVGIATEDGFTLLGRAQGAQAKGCSMAVDDFLKAAKE